MTRLSKFSTRTKAAAAVCALVVLAPTSAMAFDVFDDVPDDQFYSEAVEWAYENGITTGTSATTFEPDASVTRGQMVTFLQRYNDTYQPTVLSTESIAGVPAVPLTADPVAHLQLAVTAPEKTPARVVLHSTATVIHPTDGGDVRCIIADAAALPPGIDSSTPGGQLHESGGLSDTSTLAGSRSFELAAGESATYVLACEESPDGGLLSGRNLTAVVTPLAGTP